MAKNTRKMNRKRSNFRRLERARMVDEAALLFADLFWRQCLAKRGELTAKRGWRTRLSQ
jgi:hypothetical protein